MQGVKHLTLTLTQNLQDLTKDFSHIYVKSLTTTIVWKVYRAR